MSEHNPDGLPEMDGFRFLNIGEKFERGDEYWQRDLRQWKTSMNWKMPHGRVEESGFTYRRRVSPASAEREPDDITKEQWEAASMAWLQTHERALEEIDKMKSGRDAALATNAELTRELSELRAAANKAQAAIHELTLTLANESRRDNESIRGFAYNKASEACDAITVALRAAKDGKGAA